MSNKILFVDDDHALLRSFERNLSFDYDMSTAVGGRAAMELVRSEGPFSVVVVDMRMPEMDGIRTIQALRELVFRDGAVAVQIDLHVLGDPEEIRSLR